MPPNSVQRFFSSRLTRPGYRFFSSASHFSGESSTSKIFQDKFQKNLAPILSHPFNWLMYRGALGRKRFKDYISIDAVYLVNYGRLMQKLAFHPEFYGNPCGQELTNIALGVIKAESNMQKRYMNMIQCDDPGWIPSVMKEYINHISLCVKKESRPGVSLASLIPCFWVYRCLGQKYPVSGINASHPYYQWLRTYSSQHFLQAERTLWNILDNQDFTENELNKAFSVFEISILYEENFFNRVMNMELTPKLFPHPIPDCSF